MRGEVGFGSLREKCFPIPEGRRQQVLSVVKKLNSISYHIASVEALIVRCPGFKHSSQILQDEGVGGGEDGVSTHLLRLPEVSCLLEDCGYERYCQLWSLTAKYGRSPPNHRCVAKY